MNVLARSAAITFAILASVSANAADLSYPPPVVGQPQYGMPAPPAGAPAQVIIVPNPAAYPQYPGAPVPPPPVVAYPYGTPAPVPPAPVPPAPIPPASYVVPPANCPPVWGCGARGCGWRPGCVPPPQNYSYQYDAPGQRYRDPQWPGPQVYVRPDAPPPPEPYPGGYSREVYPGPSDPYSW